MDGMARCNRCEFEWLPYVKDPVECPKCKSRFWNKERVRRKQPKEEHI